MSGCVLDFLCCCVDLYIILVVVTAKKSVTHSLGKFLFYWESARLFREIKLSRGISPYPHS